MTNQEIIDGLKFTADMVEFDTYTGGTKTHLNEDDKITVEACRAAIKALEREPCEDAVSREAVKEILVDGCDIFRKTYIDAAIYHIDHLPSVQPQTVDWDAMIDEIKKLFIYKSREDYVHQEYTRDFIDRDEVIETINKYRNGEKNKC